MTTTPQPKLTIILPPEWDAAIDPDTKETYYFHIETNETSWDPPPGSKPLLLLQGSTSNKNLTSSSNKINLSKKGKSLLKQSLNEVDDDMKQEEAELINQATKEVDSDVSDEDDDSGDSDTDNNRLHRATSAESTKSSSTTTSNTNGTTTTTTTITGQRSRRRSTYLGGKIVMPQRPPHNPFDSRLVVPPSKDTKAGQGFVDVSWYKGAGKNSREQCFYSVDFDPIVRFVNATRTLKPATFQIYGGTSDVHLVQLQANRLVKPKVFKLTYENDVIYTLRKKGKSKIQVIEGDSVAPDFVRYVVQFGPDRICIKTRDASGLGITLGDTNVDWRPDPNPQALLDQVRLGSGFDVILAMACFGLADWAFDYGKTITASADIKKKVSDASVKLKGSSVDFVKALSE
jgi:hypothetical protein